MIGDALWHHTGNTPLRGTEGLWAESHGWAESQKRCFLLTRSHGGKERSRGGYFKTSVLTRYGWPHLVVYILGLLSPQANFTKTNSQNVLAIVVVVYSDQMFYWTAKLCRHRRYNHKPYEILTRYHLLQYTMRCWRKWTALDLDIVHT